MTTDEEVEIRKEFVTLQYKCVYPKDNHKWYNIEGLFREAVERTGPENPYVVWKKLEFLEEGEVDLLLFHNEGGIAAQTHFPLNVFLKARTMEPSDEHRGGGWSDEEYRELLISPNGRAFDIMSTTDVVLFLRFCHQVSRHFHPVKHRLFKWYWLPCGWDEPAPGEGTDFNDIIPNIVDEDRSMEQVDGMTLTIGVR